MTNVFQPKCYACHSGANPIGGLTFDSYTKVSQFVFPGDANNSLIYVDIESGKMPKGDPALSPLLVYAVGSWIEGGAQNN